MKCTSSTYNFQPKDCPLHKFKVLLEDIRVYLDVTMSCVKQRYTKSFGKFDVFLCQVDPFVHCQSYYLKERDIEQRSWPNTELRTYFDATLILMYVAYDLLYRQYNLVLRLLKKLQPVLMSDQFHVLVLYSRPWQKDQLSFLNQSRRGCCDWGKCSKVCTGK